MTKSQRKSLILGEELMNIFEKEDSIAVSLFLN